MIAKKTISKYLWGLIFLTITSSCTLFDEPQNPLTENEYIYEYFKSWYLWYDQIPETDPNSYSSQSELIKAIRTDVDRWSFSGSYEQISKFFQSGELNAFGAGFLLDSDNRVKITFVYPDSPFGKLGVQRGWVVESANGFGPNNLEGMNNMLSSDAEVEFLFTNNLGENVFARIKKDTFITKPVLYTNVFEKGNKRIGYVVFNSFIESAKEELNQVFTLFQQKNITDLIVDLRYNGGGLNDVALQLIGQIGGDKTNKQVVSKTLHNTKKAAYNKEDKIEINNPVVNISKVYFLTSKGTASASELVINSLKPFMEVKTIGSPTHGKPVGMYVFKVEHLDLAIVPICFKSVNKVGEGDYYSGISVDIDSPDGLSHNWGSPEEDMLKAALNDIMTIQPTASAFFKESNLHKQCHFYYSGLNQIVNVW